MWISWGHALSAIHTHYRKQSFCGNHIIKANSISVDPCQENLIHFLNGNNRLFLLFCILFCLLFNFDQCFDAPVATCMDRPGEAEAQQKWHQAGHQNKKCQGNQIDDSHQQSGKNPSHRHNQGIGYCIADRVVIASHEGENPDKRQQQHHAFKKQNYPEDDEDGAVNHAAGLKTEDHECKNQQIQHPQKGGFLEVFLESSEEYLCHTMLTIAQSDAGDMGSGESCTGCDHRQQTQDGQNVQTGS